MVFRGFLYLKNEKLIYFQSFKGSTKEKEFEINPNVAFTTVRKDGMAYVRTNKAMAKKSEKTIFDVQNLFIEKMPFYKGIIEHNGNSMNLYEVHFSIIKVWLDPDNFHLLQL